MAEVVKFAKTANRHDQDRLDKKTGTEGVPKSVLIIAAISHSLALRHH